MIVNYNDHHITYYGRRIPMPQLPQHFLDESFNVDFLKRFKSIIFNTDTKAEALSKKLRKDRE